MAAAVMGAPRPDDTALARKRVGFGPACPHQRGGPIEIPSAGDAVSLNRKIVFILIVLAIAQVVGWGTIGLPPVIGRQIAADLHMDIVAIFAGTSVHYVAMGLCAPALGSAFVRFGARRVMIVGTLVAVPGFALLAFSSGPVVYFAAWVVLGAAGSATLSTASYIMLNEVVGSSARNAIGALMLGDRAFQQHLLADHGVSLRPGRLAHGVSRLCGRDAARLPPALCLRTAAPALDRGGSKAPLRRRRATANARCQQHIASADRGRLAQCLHHARRVQRRADRAAQGADRTFPGRKPSRSARSWACFRSGRAASRLSRRRAMGRLSRPALSPAASSRSPWGFC